MPYHDSEELQHIGIALQTWEHARMRGWHNRFIQRLPRPLAGVVHTTLRLVLLGRTLEAQSQLYFAIVTHQRALAKELASYESSIASLEAHARHVDQQTRQLQATFLQRDTFDAELHAIRQYAQTHQQEIQQHIDKIQAQIQQASTDIDTHIAALTNQIQQQHNELRQHTSYIRMLMQQQQRDLTFPRKTDATAMNGAEVLELLQRIEQTHPALTASKDIELSISGTIDESALAMGAAFFGQRMSSSSSNYRAPNDSWYHIELDQSWNTDQHFQNASARLVHGGWHVLITSPGTESLPHLEDFNLVATPLIQLGSERKLQVYIWQHM